MLMHVPASLAASSFDGGQRMHACGASASSARIESSLQYASYPYQIDKFTDWVSIEQFAPRRRIAEFMPSILPSLKRFIRFAILRTIANHIVIDIRLGLYSIKEFLILRRQLNYPCSGISLSHYK